MRILLVNVNTTESLTRAMTAAARAVAAPGTEVVGLTPSFGPASVEGHFESYLSAVAVMDAVVSYPGSYDAVVQAGFGEHGREGLQELLEVPVVDITEAAAITACLLGHRYGVITSLDRSVPQILDRLQLAGLHTRCAGVRASGLSVLELERDPRAALAAIVVQAQEAVLQDGAEVLCLGCGGMAGLVDAVRDATGVPVVDGVAAAVVLAEGLIRQSLRTSKVRSFAAPQLKRVTGWPISGGPDPDR